jgi:rare lipoprotein A
MRLVFLFFVFFFLNCTNEPQYNYEEIGIASFYANMFEGKITANGEIFSQDSLTAAHKTLPFGTEVLVVNPKNEKSVNVVINDRGPFRRLRIIDLTRRAADSLGILDSGLEHVIIYADTTGMNIGK